MDWQHILTWFAIGVAGAYVLWRGRRVLRGTKTGCGGSCGCAKPASQAKTPAVLIAPEQLVLRKK
jgi:hypothetical protein